jgi:FHA domain-containing protein
MARVPGAVRRAGLISGEVTSQVGAWEGLLLRVPPRLTLAPPRLTVLAMLPCFISLDANADFRLDDPLTLVGRSRACEVCLDASRVSRHHCCLAFGHGEILVRDLDSTNGTRINGRRVEKGLLRPGDVLGIAHLRFRLIVLDWTEGPGSRETHRDEDAAAQR